MADQTGCLNRGLRVLGWAIVALFLITLPPAIIMRAASVVFFEPVAVANSLQQGLLESGSVRQTTVDLLLDSLSDPQNEEFLAEMAAELSTEDWQQISEIALPDEWLDEELKGLVTSFYDWLDGNEVRPDLKINIEPVKRRLLGEGSSQIVGIMVESWPDCTLTQALEFEEAFRQSGELPLAICKLPEPLQSVVVARVTEEFQQQARSMPASLDLTESMSAEENDRLLPIKSQLRQLRLIARWTFLVPLSLLGVLMALVVRTWRDWLRWWGGPLLLGGGLTLLLSLFLLGVQPGWAAKLGQSMELPRLLAGSIQNVLMELGERVVWRGAIWGGGIAAAGSLLLAISFILPEPGPGSIPLSKKRGSN